MAIANEPRIILRYDCDLAREKFEATFGTDFHIDAVTTDQSAMAALNEVDAPATALLLLSEQPTPQLLSPLLTSARDCHPDVLKILLGDAIPLDLLVSLLDQRLIDRCFKQPINPDLIRSQILAAALTVPTPSDDPSQPARDQITKRPIVLIVDDESAATEYLARQLERLQDEFQVLCADNADQALDCIRMAPDRIAVVMTDQRMPGMSGKELLDQLKQSHPTSVRILTSAYGEVDVALDAVNEGQIFRYQKKPWRATDLLPLFQKAITRHRELVAAQLCSRSQRQQEFAQLRQQRQRRLEQTLADTVQGVAGAPVMTEFLEALSSIEPLLANTSHIRASQETALEKDLVQRFAALVWQKLASVQADSPKRISLEKDSICAGLRAAAGQDDSDTEEISTLTLMCQALTTLLKASGQDWGDLEIIEATHNGELVLATPTPLRIYTHLLAPLTRISRQLLEQQTALLMLFIAVRRLGGELQVTASPQSCELFVRFTPSQLLDQSC